MNEDLIKTKVAKYFEGLTFDQKYRHTLPFGDVLSSRMVCSLICGYTWKGTNCCQVMQNLSRRSRAFIISQEGLPGFLVYFDLSDWLESLPISLLDKFGVSQDECKTLARDLTVISGSSDREARLREISTGLYALALKKMLREEEY